ncbi:phosphate acyltransferase PlsX [Halotalea alkalilenta]|uniref:Phosphate acyltransferase n=1 Tax=Halotalea alkalilenta TaxID=376489 RepID=A0A172YK48_9GAMM|nr:phosphate acyltransferase PlsX [Halotalea alkalilenta]ANF59628.1 hypothetical protein A5892_11175 [Halotalea alkalilenta]
MRIAIDAMGGDFGPRVIVRGCFEALKRDASLSLLLFGSRASLDEAFDALPRAMAPLRERISLRYVERSFSSAELPSHALRGRYLSDHDASSLHASIRAVERGEAMGCVSAGDTGALMAVARHCLGMLEGIVRPAISSAIPTIGERPCYVLDLGANVDCQPRHLLQFARMGAEMVSVVDGIERPRVALLNIGSETRKGSRLVRETDALLRALDAPRFDYQGFVEGDGIYAGSIDVIVCDGFVGNVALKTSEGLAKMLGRKLQVTFEANWRTRLVSFLARPALSRFRREIDPVRYNGASLLGLSATVVKSHGGADALGFSYAISRAVTEVSGRLPARLAEGLAK